MRSFSFAHRARSQLMSAFAVVPQFDIDQARPAHDQVQAARTSFLAIVRGLEKSGHILLSLLVAATAAGCWTGLYWLTESAPAMAASVVVTLLYTLLHLLDQKQAAALTCLGGWVLVNTLFLALTFSLSSDVLVQLLDAAATPSMQAVFAAALWCVGMWLSVQPLAMRTRLMSGVAGAVLHVAAFAVGCHRREGVVRMASTVVVTRLLGLAGGALFVHVARRHGGRFHAVVRGLQQLGEQLKELDGELQAQATASAASPTARRSKTPPPPTISQRARSIAAPLNTPHDGRTSSELAALEGKSLDDSFGSTLFAVSEECEVAAATPPPLLMPSTRVGRLEERAVSALAAWLGGAVYLYIVYNYLSTEAQI